MASTAAKHTIYDGMKFDDYEFQEFPVAMYKGKSGYREALTKEEIETNKKLGWHLTPPDAEGNIPGAPATAIK
jgi:hypothetical protein